MRQSATDRGPILEHVDAQARAREDDRADEPVGSCADDDDVEPVHHVLRSSMEAPACRCAGPVTLAGNP